MYSLGREPFLTGLYVFYDRYVYIKLEKKQEHIKIQIIRNTFAV